MQTSKLWDSFSLELLVYAMSEYQYRVEEANCASSGYFVHRFCQSSDISGKNRTRIFNDTFAIHLGATRVIKSNFNVSKLCPILWWDVGPFTEYRFGTLSVMIFRGGEKYEGSWRRRVIEMCSPHYWLFVEGNHSGIYPGKTTDMFNDMFLLSPCQITTKVQIMIMSW